MARSRSSWFIAALNKAWEPGDIAAAVDVARGATQDARMQLEERVAAASVLVLAENYRDAAALLEPDFFTIRSVTGASAVLRDLSGVNAAHTAHVFGALAALRGNKLMASTNMQQAYRFAYDSEAWASAIAFRLSIARFARLFGDVNEARTALQEACDIADRYGLPEWAARCRAEKAHLLLDNGDVGDARATLEAITETTAPDVRARIASIGLGIGFATGDEVLLRRSLSSDVLRTAARGRSAREVLDACTAIMMMSRYGAISDPDGGIVDRALAYVEPGVDAAEFLLRVIAYARNSSALYAGRLLEFAGGNRHHRRTVALRHLGRALLYDRLGQHEERAREAAIAARACNRANGIARWGTEAMNLIVKYQEEDAHSFDDRWTSPPAQLTRRERQVAQLASSGASNRTIAVFLKISEHTVERHITSILARLGLHSRWQIPEVLSKRSKLL